MRYSYKLIRAIKHFFIHLKFLCYDWTLPMIEVAIIFTLCCGELMGIIDVSQLLGKYFPLRINFNDQLPQSFQIVINCAMTLIIALLLIWGFNNKYKGGYRLNHTNRYHIEKYWGYWVCSKILGIRRCELKLVPIPIQYKLLFDDTFSDFVLPDGIEQVPEPQMIHMECFGECIDKCNNCNLIIADTYSITRSQLPDECKNYYSVAIYSSSIGPVRYYKPDLVHKIRDVIHHLPLHISTLHIFATTNPVNNCYIVKTALNTGGRDHLEKIMVYFQSSSENRDFQHGMEVYKRRESL